MAGDWIKIEHALPNKPEVMAMAEELGISELEVVGHLVCFWTWVDQNLSQVCPRVSGTERGLDRVAGRTGFARAMVQVGWLKFENGTIEIPNYDSHLSQTAKSRSFESKRKKKQRQNLSQGVRDISGTKPGTREEKRREEKNSKGLRPLEPYPEKFEEFWKVYPRRVKKRTALAAWSKALPFAGSSKNKKDGETVEDFLIRCAKIYDAASAKQESRFIQHPSTWLNAGGWDDEAHNPVPTDDDLKGWTPNG